MDFIVGLFVLNTRCSWQVGDKIRLWGLTICLTKTECNQPSWALKGSIWVGSFHFGRAVINHNLRFPLAQQTISWEVETENVYRSLLCPFAFRRKVFRKIKGGFIKHIHGERKRELLVSRQQAVQTGCPEWSEEMVISGDEIFFFLSVAKLKMSYLM